MVSPITHALPMAYSYLPEKCALLRKIPTFFQVLSHVLENPETNIQFYKQEPIRLRVYHLIDCYAK